jgi:hypothetical protein
MPSLGFEAIMYLHYSQKKTKTKQPTPPQTPTSPTLIPQEKQLSDSIITMLLLM